MLPSSASFCMRVSYPWSGATRSLEGILVAVLCEFTSLLDHTERLLPFSLLPAPQGEAHGEEEIIVIALAPRLE
jgi:hypothetical protein